MTKSADKPPAIDIDMLTMALQAGDLDTAWWLDTQNGDVIPAPEPDGDAIEQKLIKERQRSPDRYIDIKPIANSIHIELMESYIATLEHAELCESLYASLQRQQPVWHFKKALATAPECEDNWYAFKEQFYALQARQWLRDRDLESKEYTSEIQRKSAIEPKVADSMQSCMELTLSATMETRRYIIWQQEQQIVLTGFIREGGAEEQLLSEVQINTNQLSGINRIIETYQPHMDVNVVESSENANLYFSNTESSGVLQGSYTEDGVFQQLMVMLDMLLGIPGIKI